MTYFDAVVDRSWVPVFNGTRKETLKFLDAEKDNIAINHWTCVPGESLQQMTVDDYMSRYAP